MGWGEIFWQFSMFLSPTSPDPLLMHFIFCRKGQLFCFFFCFEERWRRTELEYSSTGKGQKIPNCVFHVSVAFICFFFFSHQVMVHWLLPYLFIWKNMCGVICGEFLLIDVQNLPRTHIFEKGGWCSFTEKKRWGKKAVIECLCFIVRIFRLETSWLKTKWDAFDIFLQLFRKHKLEMSWFWCFVSLIFVSSLNILVCVKMWQFKNERCDNFL